MRNFTFLNVFFKMGDNNFIEYDEKEVEELKVLEMYWSRSKSQERNGNSCDIVRYVRGSRRTGKQKNLINKGPARLLPYQVSYMRKYKKFPVRLLCVSHLCGMGYKKRRTYLNLCVNPQHLTSESIPENNRRKKCHRLILEFMRKHPELLSKKTTFFADDCGVNCPHDTQCFRNLQN